MSKNLLIVIGLFFCQVLHTQAVNPENGPLYADTIVPRIDIIINADTLNWIYNNPASDIEFHAHFVFNNGILHDTIDNVGFRLRGNTSRYSKKKSFKVSFNTFTTGGKYFGVEKLNLNGEHNDPSVMRAKVMWDILRAWGIAAPRANHVRLYINGKYHGLYLNVEHIDEEFALSRFGNKNGNLYKCLYPADLDYLGEDPDNYKIVAGDRRVYDLRTNTEEDDYSDIAALAGILANSPDEELGCSLDSLFNTGDYLKIMAADIFCGNWDGYIYNKNNFYLYHNTASGKLEYIPYDVDNTFGIDWFGIDWAVRNIYDWQPGGSQKRHLYDRLINNPELRDQFTWYAKQLVTSVLDIDSMMQRIEARKYMIAPYVANDTYYPLDYGYDYDDFLQSYINPAGQHVKYGLYSYLYARKLSMNQQLEAGTMIPVVKYIWHQRDPDGTFMVSAFVETDEVPVTTTLLYTQDDNAIQQVAMINESNGYYSATLENIPGDEKLTYQVMVTDGIGNVKILPCHPASVRPVSGETPLLFINEFMADNYSFIADDQDRYSDWIEIYNGDNEDIWLGDFYLTDNLSSPDKWRLPGVILPAGSFKLLWADGETYNGDHHASFKLDKDGEEIGLFDADLLVVDTLSFGEQDENISSGRETDGAAMIIFFSIPTPGTSNNIILHDDPLVVWPVPATGPVIKLSRQADCRIYNSSGVLIYRGKEVDEIDISSYASGLYIIVTDEGLRAKFIVVKTI